LVVSAEVVVLGQADVAEFPDLGDRAHHAEEVLDLELVADLGHAGEDRETREDELARDAHLVHDVQPPGGVEGARRRGPLELPHRVVVDGRDIALVLRGVEVVVPDLGPEGFGHLLGDLTGGRSPDRTPVLQGRHLMAVCVEDSVEDRHYGSHRLGPSKPSKRHR
jgi:hypothetical protein